MRGDPDGGAGQDQRRGISGDGPPALQHRGRPRSEEDVNRRLREIITRSFQEVRGIAARERVDMRTAAYILAVGRVAEASLMRGVYP